MCVCVHVRDTHRCLYKFPTKVEEHEDDGIAEGSGRLANRVTRGGLLNLSAYLVADICIIQQIAGAPRYYDTRIKIKKRSRCSNATLAPFAASVLHYTATFVVCFQV